MAHGGDRVNSSLIVEDPLAEQEVTIITTRAASDQPRGEMDAYQLPRRTIIVNGPAAPGTGLPLQRADRWYP